MSPAALKRALDPAYIGSPFAQPFQFFDGDASTPMDLTGRAVVLSLDRQGLPDAHHEIAGTIQAEGRVLFSVADTSDWIKGDYTLEVRLDGASVVVGRIAVAKGAAANGSDMVGAAQPPTAPGVVIAGSGVVQVVSVAPSGTTDPSAIILPADLATALGGAQTLADALLWLAQNGGTPSPILRDLIGNVVISGVASGALSVAAAGEVLLSGAISSVSAATGSLTVGSASSIALVGSAVSTTSLTAAMTVVTQIALAGTAAGSSAVAGSLSIEAPPSEVTVLATRMFGAGHGQTNSTSTSNGTAQTTSLTQVNESGAAMTKVSLAYIGWALQAAGIGTPGNDIPITGAVIEYPSGTVVGTMTKAGATSWSVPNNSDVTLTDQITLTTPIPAGASFVVRSTDQVPNGQKRIHQGGLVGVMTTAMSNTLKKVRIFAIGDSIMTQDARGAVLLAAAGKCPVLQISIGGTKASSYVGTANDRLAKLAKDVGCTHSVSNMGTNDHGAGQSEATTAAALTDEKRAFEAQGLSHWWATTLAQQTFAPLAVVSAVVDSAAEPVLTVTVTEAAAARMESVMAYSISGDTGTPSLNKTWWMTKTGPTTWTAPASTDLAGVTGAGTLTLAPSSGSYSSTIALVPSGVGMVSPTPATSIRANINARGRAGEFGNVLEWADYFETARNSGINVTRQDQPNAYHADNIILTVASGLSSATRFSFSPSTFSNRSQGGRIVMLTGAQRGRAATSSGSGANDVSIFSGLTAAPAIGDQFVMISGSAAWSSDGVHPSLGGPPGGAQTRLVDINKAWIDSLLAA